MISALLFVLAAQAIDAPIPDRVTITRADVCTGSVDYRLPLRDAQVRALSGDAFRSLPLIVPCARLDAVDTLIAVPAAVSSRFTVQTQEVHVSRNDAGLCRAQVFRTLTPIDADVREARGDLIVEQALDVTCTRITQALVGAQIRRGGGAGWPVRLVALPLPVEP
jgi:hypothetical protein